VKTKVMVKIASLLKATTVRIVNASRRSLLDPAAKRSLMTTKRIPITRNAMPNKLSVSSRRVNRPMTNKSLLRASKKNSLRRKRKRSLKSRKKKSLRRRKRKNQKPSKKRRKRNLRLSKKKKRKNLKPSKKRKKRSLRRSQKKRKRKSPLKKKMIRRKRTSLKRKKRPMIRAKKRKTRARSKSLRSVRTKARVRSASLKKVTTRMVNARSRRSLLAQPTTPLMLRVKDHPKTLTVSTKGLLLSLMKIMILRRSVLTCLPILATNLLKVPCTTSKISRTWMETGLPRVLIQKSQQPSSLTCAITRLRTSVVLAKMTRLLSELMKLATARC